MDVTVLWGAQLSRQSLQGLLLGLGPRLLEGKELLKHLAMMNSQSITSSQTSNFQ